MKTRKLTLAVMGALLLWTLTAMASQYTQHEHALKVGRRGEITLTKPTKVGDTLLQPDTYLIQHRVSGGHHFVRFIELKQIGEAPDPEDLGQTYTEEDKAGEIKCQVEPAVGLIKKTTVYTITENGIPRITKVAIRGENVFHVF